MARDQFSDWPPEVQQVPNVGPDLQIDVDELAAMDLDLVLASESVPGMERVNEELEQAGLPYLVLAPTSLAEIREDVRRVGQALQLPQRAQRVAEAMAEGIREVEAAVVDVEPVDVYWEWWPKPAIAPGAGGWMDEVIQRAGGRNVFGDRRAHSFETDLEQLRQADPDVVALCWQGTLHAKQSLERFREREEGAWGQLRAAREDRLLLMPEALFGRPGPRIVEGIRQLAAELHPERAEALPAPYAWVPDGVKDRLPLS